MSYTFGDNLDASRRLRHLAEVYEPETRALLERVYDRSGSRRPELAIDLGCGPGWSTQLLHGVLRPQRTIGLDSSRRYITEARANHPQLEFLHHDILQSPFPVGAPDLLLCRFLLTHLSSPHHALQIWAGVAAHNAILLIHETEELESNDPAMQRYYELVEDMQRHYGQMLNVGSKLEACIAGSKWSIRQSRSIVLQKPAREMAQLHLPNLRTWGKNEYASQSFNRRELEELEETLDRIASGVSEGGIVRNTARQIIAKRD
jgi:trans-aconitate 2-methyltransferase